MNVYTHRHPFSLLQILFSFCPNDASGHVKGVQNGTKEYCHQQHRHKSIHDQNREGARTKNPKRNIPLIYHEQEQTKDS
jgi:hypothetical protein